MKYNDATIQSVRDLAQQMLPHLEEYPNLTTLEERCVLDSGDGTLHAFKDEYGELLGHGLINGVWTGTRGVYFSPPAERTMINSGPGGWHLPEGANPDDYKHGELKFWGLCVNGRFAIVRVTFLCFGNDKPEGYQRAQSVYIDAVDIPEILEQFSLAPMGMWTLLAWAATEWSEELQRRAEHAREFRSSLVRQHAVLRRRPS